MEKITKDELLEKLGGFALSDDELENVSGGYKPGGISISGGYTATCEDQCSNAPTQYHYAVCMEGCQADK